VIPIHLPALRERREDIPLLARAFLEKFRETMGKPMEGFEAEAITRMESYDWPGNVRELENTIERSVALETGRMIGTAVLPEKIRYSVPAGAGQGLRTNGKPVLLPDGIDLEKHMAETERAYLVAALEASDGVGTRAAELLKMSYRSFRHCVKKYNLS
jgi:two-component system response regulator PilR (NtrC family)